MTPPPNDRRSTYDDVLAHVAHKRRKRRCARAPPQPPLGGGHDRGGGAGRPAGAVRGRRRRQRGVRARHPQRRVAGHAGGRSTRHQLADLRSRRPPAGDDLVDREPHAGGVQPDLAVAEDGHRRHRGSALLPARRPRLPGHPARRRRQRAGRRHPAGRLHAGTAAGAKPLPVGRAVVDAQGARGLPGHADGRPVVEGQDPRRVHERRAVRRCHLRLRGGRAALLQPPLQAAQPAPGGAAGRAAAEPDHL